MAGWVGWYCVGVSISMCSLNRIFACRCMAYVHTYMCRCVRMWLVVFKYSACRPYSCLLVLHAQPSFSALPLPLFRCRNPEPSKRPSFSSITDYLSQEDLSLLHIHADDRGLPPAAYMLGAPLEEGRPLYKDLQGMYLKRPATSDQPPCAGYEVPTSTRSK